MNKNQERDGPSDVHTHEYSCERAELGLMDDIKNPEKRQN